MESFLTRYNSYRIPKILSLIGHQKLNLIFKRISGILKLAKKRDTYFFSDSIFFILGNRKIIFYGQQTKTTGATLQGVKIKKKLV